MALRDTLDGLRRNYANLNEREQKLVVVLGVILGALFILVPSFLIAASISEMEDNVQAYASVLRDMAHSEQDLSQCRAKREAFERLPSAPPLRTFLSGRAESKGIAVGRVDDEPDVAVGKFKRRHVRAELQGVALQPTLEMLRDIDSGEYPVAIERIDVSRYSGGDRYTFRLGVVAFDAKAPTRRRGGGGDDANGPPSPP